MVFKLSENMTKKFELTEKMFARLANVGQITETKLKKKNPEPKITNIAVLYKNVLSIFQVWFCQKREDCVSVRADISALDTFLLRDSYAQLLTQNAKQNRCVKSFTLQIYSNFHCRLKK